MDLEQGWSRAGLGWAGLDCSRAGLGWFMDVLPTPGWTIK